MKRVRSFEEFFREIQKELRKQISKSIKDENIRYALQGGKLLRPAMLILSFKVCNGRNYKRAIETALGVELAHSASLVHDDIVDGDRERRGRPSLYVKKGLGVAILTGHIMINEAFRIALKHSKKNAFIFLDTWSKTLEGELKDIAISSKILEYVKRGEIRQLLEEYFKVIDLKTASLFSAACKAGAIEAKASEEVIEVLARYGREVGISYQLADDLVDMMNGRFDEGLILPLSKFHEEIDVTKAIRDNSKIVKDLLEERKRELMKVYVEEIEKHVRYAEKLASSDIIRDGPYKAMLKEAPRYIVNKMLKEVGVVI